MKRSTVTAVVAAASGSGCGGRPLLQLPAATAAAAAADSGAELSKKMRLPGRIDQVCKVVSYLKICPTDSMD